MISDRFRDARDFLVALLLVIAASLLLLYVSSVLLDWYESGVLTLP